MEPDQAGRHVRSGLPGIRAFSGWSTPPTSALVTTCWSSEPPPARRLLRFTRDTLVWTTSNISERGVRPLKTQQKLPGRLTSVGITQDRPGIRSYIDTAREHGQDVMTVLRGVITGTPGRPEPAGASL